MKRGLQHARPLGEGRRMTGSASKVSVAERSGGRLLLRRRLKGEGSGEGGVKISLRVPGGRISKGGPKCVTFLHRFLHRFWARFWVPFWSIFR